MKIRTEFNFVLPRGYIDENGNETKIRGVMRLVKVKDQMDINRDMRVKESSSYFYVVLLSKVISKLSSEKMITTKVIEDLSTENFTFLVDFLNEINHKVLSGFPVKCSNCNEISLREMNIAGGQ